MSIVFQQDEFAKVYLHDFGSCDGTRDLIALLAEEYTDRLIVTCHDDAPGTKASFIRAIRETIPYLASDALVFFADQDDVWLPQKLKTIRHEITERKMSAAEPFILFHDVHVVDERLRVTRSTYYTGNPFRVPRDLDRSRLMMANPAIGHTMVLSMPLLRELSKWPDTDAYLMHDWLAILIASRIGRAEQVPRALSLYRQHGGNVLGAYRKGNVPSVRRLLAFTDRIVSQAVAFVRAIDARQSELAEPLARSPLEATCRNGYRVAAATLAVGAAIYGPTWQRKAIGLLLMLRAIIGPARR